MKCSPTLEIFEASVQGPAILFYPVTILALSRDRSGSLSQLCVLLSQVISMLVSRYLPTPVTQQQGNGGSKKNLWVSKSKKGVSIMCGTHLSFRKWWVTPIISFVCRFEQDPVTMMVKLASTTTSTIFLKTIVDYGNHCWVLSFSIFIYNFGELLQPLF